MKSAQLSLCRQTDGQSSDLQTLKQFPAFVPSGCGNGSDSARAEFLPALFSA
uniref:Uncharacterized protein n=1 Tax=Anguilla anguilla TaxID=7936 RepID=A0A0E9XG44_ANGAN